MIAGGGGGFFHVANIQHRFGGQQVELAHRVFLAVWDGGAGRPAFGQRRDQWLHQFGQRDRFLVAAARALLRLHQPLLQAFEIRQHEFGFHHVGIAAGVDIALDMRNVGVFETAEDVDDGVHLPDIRQELVSQALAFGRAAHQPGDIDEFQSCRNNLDGFADLPQHGQTRIGHADAADIRLDGTKGIVGGLRGGGRGQRVEQGRFADVRQPDDAAIETHLTVYPA